MRGDLRSFRLGMLRGRDGAARDRPGQPVSSQPAHRPGTGLPPLLALGQDRPDVSGTAFVASGAVLIGRIAIGAEASVWYGAVLRADRDAIVVGERSNVQDGCVLHADPGVPLWVGSQVTIGHNAMLHGCIVEDLVLIGMGAIVLNGARVGRHSIIAAGTVLAEGQQVPEGCWWRGCRARSGVRCPDRSAQDPAQRRHVRRAIPAASPRRSVRCAVPGPVRFQNSAIGPDLGFYAARSYSLMRPPRTGRRWIRFRERSATG